MADRRLFLALWPDDTTRKQLVAASRDLHIALGGRALHPDSLHLTLAFLGETPEAQLEPLQAALANVSVAPMSLRLDRYGWWKPGIGWLGMSEPCEALLTLADAARTAMHGERIRYDRKAFKPHVTLLRDARQGDFPPLAAPIAWQSGDFHLIETVQGRYRSLARFPA